MLQWDEKAKTFPKYQEKMDAQMLEVFSFLKNKLDFKGKRVVDIGAGTGVWSLHIAALALSIDLVDPSARMLFKAKESIKKHGFKNAQCINESLESFKCKQKYDIAFLSRCPALNDTAGVDKFLNLAEKRVSITFEKASTSTLINRALEKLTNFNSQSFFKPNIIKKRLNELNLNYYELKLQKSHKVFRTHEEAYALVANFFLKHKLAFKENELKALFLQAGEYEQSCTYRTCLLY